jgi:hypothetical protein
VYIGHAGLALFAKSRSRRLSLALLVAVAFAPDWIEWALGVKAGNTGSRATMLSHSVVSVAIGATLAALAALAARRTWREAFTLFALYTSHWLADFLTGRKPTWPHGPVLGLMLYDRPMIDFGMEAVLAVACSLAYLRTLPPGEGRVPRWTLPVLLVALQAAFTIGMQQTG